MPILEFVPSDSTAQVGDAFSVDVVASDFTDLFGFQGFIFFDPTILGVSSITQGSFLSSFGATDFVGLFGAGDILLIDILLDAETGASGSGVLATLNFTGQAAGVSLLLFSDFFMFDSLGGIIDAGAINGTATITAVPEPSSLALFAIGFLALGFAFRSRLRRSRT